MFEIYLTKSAQDAMSKDYIYLLMQTMRIFNALKLFVLIAEDIKNRGPDDIINDKKYIELLLYHAGNLNEVLVTLKKDLLPRYRQIITKKSTLTGLDKWEQCIKNNDETNRVLTTIRNKHSFHIAHDPYYPWKYITDDPATSDKLVGVGETMQGSGWFFTWDTDIILAFLRDHALMQKTDTVQDYMRIKKIIDDASVDLYKLFEAIVDEMIRSKIYIKGNKTEASIDYRDKKK